MRLDVAGWIHHGDDHLPMVVENLRGILNRRLALLLARTPDELLQSVSVIRDADKKDGGFCGGWLIGKRRRHLPYIGLGDALQLTLDTVVL